MKYKYIAVEREYGSGGTEVARQLSEATGIPVYGKELLEMVAEETGVPVDLIQKYEEKSTNSFLYSIVMLSRLQQPDGEFSSQEDKVFYYEKNIIRSLADKGPAIFVGHCAGEVLNDRRNVLRVFITADLDSKMTRIRKEYEIPEKEAESTRKRFDNKRAAYYAATTGKEWRDLSGYDLVLNTGTMGVEETVRILRSIVA